MEQLLGGEVYHYHHKMILKEPLRRRGLGMAPGLRLLVRQRLPVPGPGQLHDRRRPGDAGERLPAGAQGLAPAGPDRPRQIGDQTGADPERVSGRSERLELVHCELEPGSAIFFHCNLLHRSDQNRSPDPRWALICCYNAARNDPYKESRHPRYTLLEKWPDERIKEIGRRQRASCNWWGFNCRSDLCPRRAGDVSPPVTRRSIHHRGTNVPARPAISCSPPLHGLPSLHLPDICPCQPKESAMKRHAPWILPFVVLLWVTPVQRPTMPPTGSSR